MLLSSFSSLLALFHLLPFGSATEQKPLKEEKAGPFTAEFESLVYETLEKWHVYVLRIFTFSSSRLVSSFFVQPTFHFSRNNHYRPAANFRNYSDLEWRLEL